MKYTTLRLLNLVFVAFVFCSPSSASTAPSDQEILENRDEAFELIETRRKLDQLIWGPEVLAQQYETKIVELWDSLLKADNKFDALKQFAFTTLTVAKHQKSEALQQKIARYTFAGEGQEYSFSAWTALIEDLQKQGYELEQSEWHHAAFNPPAGNSAASSSVSFEMHIARQEPAHRIVVKGVADILWAVDASAGIQADEISVSQMKILEREMPPAFQEVFNVNGTDEKPLIHPVLVYDLDKDGNSEILVGGQNMLIRNFGEGGLAAEPIFKEFRPMYDAGVIADFTGDGWPDFVAVDDRGYPFIAKGNEKGTFAPKVKASDFYLNLPKTFTAGDIDGDGDLDLYIANYKYAYRQGQMPSPYYDANDGYPAVMLENDGNGKFTDVTEKVGLAAKRYRRAYSSSFVDLDNDRDMDLIVVSDYAGFDIFLNDGKGKFEDITDEFGLDRHFFGMGHTFDDFNQDGLLDFYVIGMSSTTARRLEQLGVGRADLEQHTNMRQAMGYGNRMFLGGKDGFEKAPFNDQVARTGWSWGTSTFDFDNDGDKDIYVANGHYSGESAQDYCTTFWRHDIYEGGTENVARDMLFQAESTDLREANISWNGFEKKVLYLKHEGEYVNIAYLMGVAFEYDARAVITEDIDSDGRPDLLVVEHEVEGSNKTKYRLHVYRNVLEEAGHWIGIRINDGKGYSTIGANIMIATEDGEQHSRIVTGDSFSAQHSAKAHFGLGTKQEVKRLEVEWFDGKKIVVENPKIDQYHIISRESEPTEADKTVGNRFDK